MEPPKLNQLFDKQNFFTKKEDIISWLNSVEIENYHLIKNSEYGWVVNVDGDVILNLKKIGYFPVKFNDVKGDFSCVNCKLRSLKGGPEMVEGNFTCNLNFLTTLEFSPSVVQKSYYCKANLITNLVGIKSVGHSLMCSFNVKLTSLEGAPEVVHGDFNCSSSKLKNLIGGPKIVHMSYGCANSSLKSLEGCPSHVGHEFDFSRNKIKDALHFPNSPLPSVVSYDNPITYKMNKLGIDSIWKMQEHDRAQLERHSLGKTVKKSDKSQTNKKTSIKI